MPGYGDDLIPQCEVARRLHRSPKTIRRWTRNGYFPSWTDPDTGTVLYSWPAVQEWEREQFKVGAAS